MSARATFAQASAVQEQSRVAGRATYAADLDPGWTVGGRPNGGYLLAILGRAAGEVSSHPDVLAVSAHFLRPPAVGPAEAELEVLHEGRSVSTHRATLRQDGRTCVEALVTTGHLDETSAYWRGDTDVPTVAPMAGFDPRSLLVAVDAFPPATFDVEVSGWVPTIQLSAYVRARPADGPVVVRHRAQVIGQGRVDESTTVWDRNGAVVAQATQLAGIRLGSRP